MTKTTQKKPVVCTTGAGTRDAVESSIDSSKNDKQTTWEQSANRRLNKIARWDDTKKQAAAAFVHH